ncbi:hypothetical protein JAAARDRAFT_42128 [Jaapia argillacea MUCL 33604]|uniref:Uncharacterized protein n=1 Tax=Jaapia argillacea MUCL 33604 TaxID=933084 RepID=A0A067PHJ5_9AGAM|nr:hypothetical protein JAAARDRAFT_42128 [Jaapia argillacea MUCL 33604]
MFSTKPKEDAVRTALKSALGVASSMGHERPPLPTIPMPFEEMCLMKKNDKYSDLDTLWLTPYETEIRTPLEPASYSESITQLHTVIPISFGSLNKRVRKFLNCQYDEDLPATTRPYMNVLVWHWREQIPMKRLAARDVPMGNLFNNVFYLVNKLLAARGICSADAKITMAGMWTRRKLDAEIRDICDHWVLRGRQDSHGPYDAQAFGFSPNYLIPRVFDLIRSWKGTGPPTTSSTDNYEVEIYKRAETIWSIILEECDEGENSRFVLTSWNQWALGYILPASEGNSKRVHITSILHCKSREPTIIAAIATCSIYRSWKEFLGGAEIVSSGGVALAVDGSVRREEISAS